MPEKIKLELKTFPNTLAMLNSPDKENIVIGLQCLENVDFKQNLTYILLAKKAANISSDVWKEHAPEVTSNIATVGVDVDRPITYKALLETIVKYKVPVEDIEFYLSSFGQHLKSEIKGMGYDFIEDVVIILQTKDKKYESSTSRTVS